MLARMFPALILGLTGVAVLMSLGFWQLSRLDEKLAQIAAIDARISDAPASLPNELVAERDRFSPVTIEGAYTGEVVHVLSAREGMGAGSRVIAALESADGRRVLIDRGFLPELARDGADFASGPVTVIGNLDWPRDADRYTPAPDMARNLWFSREVAPIAAHLETESVMIVARQDATVPNLVPTPIDSADLRNDHLEYAITWFLLAAAWAGMTAFLLWRIRQNKA